MPFAHMRSPNVIETSKTTWQKNVLGMQLLAALEHSADASWRARTWKPRASLTSQVLGCVWIVAKVHLAKIFVMTKRLVFVWMVAIFWHANEL